jgi:hypothetical protein
MWKREGNKSKKRGDIQSAETLKRAISNAIVCCAKF